MPGNWQKKTFVQTIFQILTWKVLLIIKNMFTMKNLTDFRKTLETGVDPRLGVIYLCLAIDPLPCFFFCTKLDFLNPENFLLR